MDISERDGNSYTSRLTVADVMVSRAPMIDRSVSE